MVQSCDQVENTPNWPCRSPFRRRYGAQRRGTAGARLLWYRPRLKIPLKLWDRLCPSRRGLLSALKLSRNLGREIGAIAIDPFAKGKAHEARYPNRPTGCLRSLLDHQGYLGLLVDDKDLLQGTTSS